MNNVLGVFLNSYNAMKSRRFDKVFQYRKIQSHLSWSEYIQIETILREMGLTSFWMRRKTLTLLKIIRDFRLLIEWCRSAYLDTQCWILRSIHHSSPSRWWFGHLFKKMFFENTNISHLKPQWSHGRCGVGNSFEYRIIVAFLTLKFSIYRWFFVGPTRYSPRIDPDWIVNSIGWTCLMEEWAQWNDMRRMKGILMTVV